MKIDVKEFRVREGREVKLKVWPTQVKRYSNSKKQLKKMLGERIEETSDLQNLLYASNRYAVLLSFQAMDAAGKDSANKHVMSGINPQGCQVFSFKHPSLEELDHDFLWRTTRCLPERGRIGIFNRSYYEEVLIVRVHPELLRAEGLPEKELDEKTSGRNVIDRSAIWKRICSVSGFSPASTSRIRIGNSAGPISKNREYWNDYMKAYEACLSATSTRQSPWYVIPADDKANARLTISQIILDTLRQLDMEYPKIDADHRKELGALRKLLER